MADADPIRPQTGPLRTVELIRDRVVEAVLGQSGLNHPALASEVRRRFGSTDVAAGALVREPVIEGAAPFIPSGKTFAECAGAPLHPDVVRAIGDPAAEPYRFDPSMQPYKHQLEAWKHLTTEERRSVLVSSGTGSGKTECFLIPLLSDLAAETEAGGRLSGVRAIALYPLNALIASQQERLRAWTAPFGGKIRFGLYNGMTPDKLGRTEKRLPEQAQDRETLRSDPPPILVTNVTMLEYMIVRRIDRPLIENSRGKLRWIILDEAHGYVGSAAAEIALLIRRVLLTFGVRAEDVRFVATSATIGGGAGGTAREVTDELHRFLRDLSGADSARVKVVVGKRVDVALPEPATSPVLTAGDLADRDRVEASPAVQAFVRAAEKGPVPLVQARGLLAPTGLPMEQVIEAVAASDAAREPLLPLRIHGFLRAVPGLWSCLNPACDAAPAEWAFGAVLPEKVDQCPSCRSPVFEVKACRDCGEPYLECEEHDGHLRAVTTPPTIDEFAAGVERDTDDEESEEESADAASDHDYPTHKLLLASRGPLGGGRDAHVVPTTGRRHDRAAEDTLPLHAHERDRCGACGSAGDDDGSMLRPLRFGAPFLIGNAAPVLLDGVPRRTDPVTSASMPPADGRQLLSFTDSRQGTARFAANLQTNAERGYVRGHIYHVVQGGMASAGGDSAQVAALRAEIAKLEDVDPVALASIIADRKATLAKVETPSVDGLSWEQMRDKLAKEGVVKDWMSQVWRTREERYAASPLAFAEFLLLREFNRRPRRGNTIETMGLARLRFDAIDKAREVPEPLIARGFGLADWQGLLYGIIDMTVRGKAAIRVLREDAHWLNARTPIARLLAPGEAPGGKYDIPWPRLRADRRGTPSNLVLIIEKALGVDRNDAHGRATVNTVLDAAWRALLPLFSSRTDSDYKLDFAQARIAPVVAAWRCPVSRRVLPDRLLGLTQYGHREHLRTADLPPQPLAFPALPVTFPRGDAVERVRNWLDRDPAIAVLRDAGVWTNLHDRSALLSPYFRTAEHSAQQPPKRLRAYEDAFKKGEINILNCSTTMEMGVDIGSVSAVMMTNVPPALANYRQRVGRAGRRRQGFAASLTYTRDTPLDREAFRAPDVYLNRDTRAPRVKLDSRRIVQRHVNALLLARWFAGAGGEVMKTRVGDFFGLPADLDATVLLDSPVATCRAWLTAPSTAQTMKSDVDRLVAGTVLAGDTQLLVGTDAALAAAFEALKAEWSAMQEQAIGAPKAGRDSLTFQLKRLAHDNLLKELSSRGVLPSHGFPTGVVPFVNEDHKPGRRDDDEDDDSSRRRRSFPTRTLDIAIRDYAPGAEVVVDGLVYRSAGVTLNWQRPADSKAANEVQSIKTFWRCDECGAADCSAVEPERCPACHAGIDRVRRFLEPAGFTADMAEKPHADTDDVSYVEPEQEQIVARGAAWAPMANPELGRMRASNEGLVFYSSRGVGRTGYTLCLDCGRAEPMGQGVGQHPLKDHEPLRFTKRLADGRCPGNEKPFKVINDIALGHETVTDVAELQPVGLDDEGAAWAVVSALREALARRLGVETGELGMAVRATSTPLGGKTHSLFLYDRASGGAGFAPQAVGWWDELVGEAADILDCKLADSGCVNGCSACVLTADLYRQAETINRQLALAWARTALATQGTVAAEDRAAPDAVLARDVGDAIAAQFDDGAAAATLWLDPASDVVAIRHGRVAALARRANERGATLTLVVAPDWIEVLDPAAKLSLRDAVTALGIVLRRGRAPTYPNGATAIAAVVGDAVTIWASRDTAAGVAGDGWGQAAEAPVVRFAGERLALAPAIDLAMLLPRSGTTYVETGDRLDGRIDAFGAVFGALLLPAIRAAGGTGVLERIDYSDRYLQTPLVVRLLTEATAALRDALAPDANAMPLRIVTNRLRPNERQPYAFDHDWEYPQDREDVLLDLLAARGFAPTLIEQGAGHGRVMTLHFARGATVRLILDQGFGTWRTKIVARWPYFGEAAARQVEKTRDFGVMIDARGPGYIVVTR